MKNIYRTILVVSLIVVGIIFPNNVYSGNKDRSGQAAASYLLINPWAGVSGWGGVGISSTKGIQSTFTNVAGLAFTRKTELAYSNSLLYTGSGVMVNGLGIAQNLRRKEGKEPGVLAVTAMIMSFGENEITTVEQPEGGLGYFRHSCFTLALSYARSFSDAVHAGATIKILNESVANASATGFTIDAGVQYIAGYNNQFQIGVTMKNIGLPMAYKGSGMSWRGVLDKDKHSILHSLMVASESAEMPALLSLGISYDFLFQSKLTKDDPENYGPRGQREIDRNKAHRLTLAGAFTANAYTRDQFLLGVEYSMMNYFQVRVGYTFESGMFSGNSTTIYVGPTAGTSVLIPLSKANFERRLAIDYAYRFTNETKGCHVIGARLIL